MLSVRNQIGGLGNLLFKEAYIYSQFRDGKIPDIYVQSEEFFEKYKHEIKDRFGVGIGNMNYVAVHVRRGDYVNNPFYVDLFEDGYYERAMQEWRIPKDEFMIFSDDISWCQKQEIFKDCMVSAGMPEVEDLNLMASCTGHIIANSSFSWWAAYLSPHGGKVVAPKKWYSDGIIRTKLPAHWKQV